MKLTPREQELYDLIVLEGKNLSQATKAMCIEYITGRTHLNNIFKKAGCSSQRELINRHYKEYCND